MSSPLKGLKVLDLTRALSGPFSTMILGDLGAEIIKVEPLPAGEMSRKWGPFENNLSLYYLSANRNKQGIAIDFREPEGLALLRSMSIASDIVVENFKPGTMDAMGLGYSSLSRERPDLIMASISGFGSVGPARHWPGFDQVIQGYSGFMSLTGTPESGPMRTGVAIADLSAGMWLTIGILSAVVERASTGIGRHVETSLLAGLMSLLGVQGQRYLTTNEVPQPSGNMHPVIAPYGSFDASDGPLNLAPATQAMWARLCDIVDVPHLVEDERFSTNAARLEKREELRQELEKSLKRKTRLEWTSLLIEGGIPAGPINTLAEAFADDQVTTSGLLRTLSHPVLGELKQVALPLIFGADEAESYAPPPAFGEDTRQVLSQYGLSSIEIDGLLARGIAYQAQVSR
ncbi:Formyl-coenzyme A transferase [Achromobacter spanius]|uniref:CaiB/BaiF CoA transferase family protein n=1 Tax=Achromobacter spanius TaxID=217203 RepID=UPI000C2C60D7|nr:CoA transferase [Achromobacter spanius]AUA60090.1 CoA transferase [Achromobacter spanius]CAB3648948.1 Acetyl-CoA:oxalate CoA-transferase [Achromobacter spanius]SPT42037.1 Formyl-coenzyme A transferase [Achromobacter denitrificans]VEE59409.1 Formyl-coenzyme A transferase [Achromobacter spanius]